MDEKRAMDHSHLFSHASYCKSCDACVKARAQRVRHPRGRMNMGPPPKKFGQSVTGDSLIDRRGRNDEDPMFPGSTNAFVLYDRATGWIQCSPNGALDNASTLKAMRHFQGPDRKPIHLHADNWPAINSAAAQMGWFNSHSMPGVPQSNGLAERMIRRVKEGGRSNLVQSGLPYAWWPYAVTHHCAARNIQTVDNVAV